MNKQGLIYEISGKSEMSRIESEISIDAVLNEIAHALVRGEDVRITGFGTFTVVTQAAKMARNPKNGDQVAVPERPTVRFKPGARLLEHLRGERGTTDSTRIIGKAARGKKDQ